MDKRSKIMLYIIGAIIVFMIMAEVTKPKAINWRDSYSAADKIPLGCYVLFNELHTFSNKEILSSKQTIYDYLKKLDTTTYKTFLFINNSIYFDGEDSKALLNFVKKGNTVFISSNYYHGNVMDSLNIAFESYNYDLFKKPSVHKFTSPHISTKNAVFKDVIENSFFTKFDTINATILGTVSIKNNDDSTETHPNFLRVKYGDNNGQFILHTNPFAFSNYHLLNNNEAYAQTVLSFLPKHQIIWDNHYKSGRKVITSPLRYILQNTALKWAFYLSMFGLILYVIFKGKRTQRIIPIIPKLENATVDFTKTIGQLYYQHRNFTNIIQKKIEYFLEFVRSNYYLNTNELSNTFIEKLATKSNNSKDKTKALIDYLGYLKSKTNHTEQDLIELNKKIEQFTNHKL